MTDESILLSEAQRFAKGLRELAAFYETYQGLPLPLEYCRSFNLYNLSPLQLVQIARAQGSIETEKVYRGETFTLVKHFTGNVKLECNTTRDQVCTKVVVGTEVIEEHIEPEKITPAKVVPRQEKEIIEWRCHPLLAPSELEALPQSTEIATPQRGE